MANRWDVDCENCLTKYRVGRPSTVEGRAKERELSLVREVPSGLIGCASAALSLWAMEGKEIQTGDISLEGREIQTGDISFAQA